MNLNRLGKTGVEISELGLGGFHLIEIELDTVRKIVEEYLKNGGNYFETAHSYGNGESEKKLGEVLPEGNFIIATKTGNRTAEGSKAELLESLKNLKKDHVDILFLHAVTLDKDWEQITAPSGALETAEWAKNEGLIRFIGITSHGYGGTLFRALKSFPFDVFMTQLNYYDSYNFPEIENQIIPYAAEKNIGMLAMKPLADGYLWKSAEKAFRYAKRFPVHSIVSGINSLEQLRQDLEFLKEKPLDNAELENLTLNSSELGSYVCRQCGKCLPCPKGISIPSFFLAEGRYDRQMLRGVVSTTDDYAVRDRFAHWFGSEERAKYEYNLLSPKPDECDGCGICTERCPYGIDIPRKLRIVRSKMERGMIW